MDDTNWQQAAKDLEGLSSGTHELCWECFAVIPVSEAIWRGVEIDDEEQRPFDSYLCLECAIDAGYFPEN